MQIFQKLREQHGYTGCYNVVQEYVRQARNPVKPESKVLSGPAKELDFKERTMARRKKHTPEQVVNLLRQIEVAVANRKTTSLACN